jgi:hypothetical protein
MRGLNVSQPSSRVSLSGGSSVLVAAAEAETHVQIQRNAVGRFVALGVKGTMVPA